MSPVITHSGSTSTGRAAPNEKVAVGAKDSAFYTVAQLAARWSICERQVHCYITSGELTATRFGRSVRVSAAEVARFEASRTNVK
jgi:excisionase family DNA binding protein